MNFSFSKTISEEVLNNYLSRAASYNFFGRDEYQVNSTVMENGMNAVFKIGAKYVPRALATWIPRAREEQCYGELGKWICYAHSIDPEIIFEGCIFEVVFSTANEISVPEWVFEEFGLQAENRYFDYKEMLFDDERELSDQGAGSYIPDITKLETQMWFYYRARRLIDIGIESLHLGQTSLIGKEDTGNACWADVIRRIRRYASEHARRNYVLINSHSGLEFTDLADGRMLVDFISSPLRLAVEDGQEDHAASEENPQKCDIYPNRDYFGKYYEKDGVWYERTDEEIKQLIYNYSPYQKENGIFGVSPSGWTTKHYPYLVEFDNWGSSESEHTSAKESLWGYDEISWLANQHASYRRYFLGYISNKVIGYGENGHVAMPGRRMVYLTALGKEYRYDIAAVRFNDTDAIAEIWKSQNTQAN